MNFPNKKYKIIYADPPWQYDDKAQAGDRGAESKYEVMSIDDICNLPVKQLADDNCVLFIWGTWTHIKEIQEVIKSWGFKYSTVGFVWLKKNLNGTNFIGMGNKTRSNTEYCLIGVRGSLEVLDHGVSQIIEAIPKKHSEKPNITRNKIIQLYGDLPRIELFARTKVHGWDVFGNDEKLQLQPLENYF